MIELSGYVQAAIFRPSHVSLQGPFPAHAARGATGSPLTAAHFPRTLHASHCPSQARSQQILSVQLLLSHSESAVQAAPNLDLPGCDAPATPSSVSPPADPADGLPVSPAAESTAPAEAVRPAAVPSAVGAMPAPDFPPAVCLTPPVAPTPPVGPMPPVPPREAYVRDSPQPMLRKSGAPAAPKTTTAQRASCNRTPVV
jgi:hypothetical protein